MVQNKDLETPLQVMLGMMAAGAISTKLLYRTKANDDTASVCGDPENMRDETVDVDNDLGLASDNVAHDGAEDVAVEDTGASTTGHEARTARAVWSARASVDRDETPVLSNGTTATSSETSITNIEMGSKSSGTD
jgi:hypothetical protein